MKIKTTSLIKIFFFVLITLRGTAQCTYDFPNGQNATINATSGDCGIQLNNNFTPGTMTPFCGLEPGIFYILSFCDPGALASFDSFITVFGSGGVDIITFNDDACGLSSEVSFTYNGPSGGCVDIVIDAFPCNNTAGGTGILGVSCSEPGPNDCLAAEVICSDGNVAFNPSGPGFDDFSNPNNNPDCLGSDENQSAWYYFEIDANAPASTILEFTVSPDGGSGEDYDFAIYGPDVPCNNLGFPVRCSFASSSCTFCPETGLGMGATDTSESPSGDGFVAPLVVQPGQGYYLLLDNFLGTSTGFDLSWSGSAAPWLDCNADPECDLEVSAEMDASYCEGETFSLSGSVTGNMGSETILWTASPSTAIGYLNSTSILNPTVTIPTGATGPITYTLTVTEDICDDLDIVTININPPPPATPATLNQCDDGTGNALFNLTSLNGTVGGGNLVTWYSNSTGTPPAISNPDAYISSGETVYAVVTSTINGCESQPTDVILTIYTPDCDDGCALTVDSFDTNCQCVNAPPNPDDGCALTIDVFDIATCTITNTPPNPDDGCPLTTDIFDIATCAILNTPPDPDDGCDLTTDVFDVATCTITNTPPDPDDGCALTTDIFDVATCMILNTSPNPDDGCDLTIDVFDLATCTITNTPPDPDDGCALTTDIFDVATCAIINTPPDPDDGCALTTDIFDVATCMILNTQPDPDDGCPLTIDVFDLATCTITNTPPDPDDGCALTTDIFDVATCAIINTPPDPDDGCPLTIDVFDLATCTITNTQPDPDDGCDLTTDVFDLATCTITNTPPDPDDGCALTTDIFDVATCAIINTPPDPDDGCPLTIDIFDLATCTITNTQPDPDDGCDLTTDVFDLATCTITNTPPDPDDGCALTTDIFDVATCAIINTPPDPDDGCDLTIDVFDLATCTITNTPPDPDDGCALTTDIFDVTTCAIINTPPDPDDGCALTIDVFDLATCTITNTSPDPDDGCDLTIDVFDLATCTITNTPPDPDDGCALTIDVFDVTNCIIINTPPNPDDGCDLTTDVFDLATCTITNTPPDPDDGCDLTTDVYDAINCVIINNPPNCDDGCPLTIDIFDVANCVCVNTPPDPDDGCDLTTDVYDAVNCIIINTPPNPDDGCALTTDIWDGVNCQIINNPPNCDDGCPLTIDIFDVTNCVCVNTPPDPDDGCDLTTDVYNAVNCVIINTPPDPDDGCDLTADSWNPTTCEILNIPPNCNDACEYTNDSFDFATCECLNILVIPDCDDNDCTTIDSYDIPNCQCTYEMIDPVLSTDTSLELCEESNEMATFDLTAVTNIVNNNSGNPVDWFDINGNQINQPNAFTTISTTVFAFIYDGETPPCQNTIASVILTVQPLPNSGVELEIGQFCNNQSSPILLGDFLEGEQAGGSWTETSVIPAGSPSFNATAGTFTPNGESPGTYTFEYTVSSIALCPSSTSTVTIQLETNAFAVLGVNNMTICNTTAGETILDLQGTVIGGDMGGDWNDFFNVGIDLSNPSAVNFEGVDPGIYLFTYTTTSAIAPCLNDSYALDVIVEDCGCPSVATSSPDGLCNENGTIDLSTLEITTELGFWSITNTPVGAPSAILSGNIFDATNATAGDYEVTFTLDVTPSSGCPESSSQIITVNPVPQPDNPGDQTACDEYTLPEITGIALSGNETYFTGSGGTGSMYIAGQTIDFSTSIYIYDNNGSCSGEVNFNITINNTPEINNPNNQIVCDSYILPEITGLNLSGNEAYYSETGGMGTVYNVGDAIMASQIVYIYDANVDCADEILFDVAIQPTPNIDEIGEQTACESYILPEITGQNINDATTYYEEPNGEGISHNAGDIISSSITLYVYVSNGECEDEIEFDIIINTPPNSGSPESALITCNDEVVPIFLETLIAGESPIGNWTETSTVQSTGGAFNPATGTFNPSNQLAGDYNFTYTLNGDAPCPDASTTVTVTVQEPPFTLFSSMAVNTCNVASQGSIVDLSILVTGGDITGIWTDNIGNEITNPSNIDFENVAEGSYFYNYTTNSAVAPCNNQTYLIEVIVEDCSCPSIATIPPNGSLCGGSDILDLTTLLITSEPGNWSITSTPTGESPAVLQGNNFNASGADAGEYEVTFTLAISPPDGCPESSSQIVVVDALPEPNNPGTLTGCEEVILPEITGENIESAIYFADTNQGGVSYNAGDVITENTTLYIYSVNGTCDAEINFDVIINSPPNAGTPEDDLATCDDDNTPISLADLLSNEDIGGIWTETSANSSTMGAFNSAAGSFTPEGQLPGTYEFTYTVQGDAPCLSVFSSVTITISAAPFTTFSTMTVNTCNVEMQGSIVDLASLINGGDNSGIWTDSANAPLSNPSNLNFDGFTPDSYFYTYTTNSAISPCENTSYQIEVIVEDCACPSVATAPTNTLCNDAGIIDLVSLQITDEAGIWTITSTPTGSNPATLDATIFDASNADAGTYEVTFTLAVLPLPGCPTSSSQIIEVNNSPNAGTGNTTESCDTNESLIDLTDFIDGNDIGGIWSINATSDAPNSDAFDALNATFNPLSHPIGTYIFDYTITGQFPCPDAFTSVTVVINPCECPSLELANADPICNENGMIDLSALQITTEVGIWSITSSPSGGNSGILNGTLFEVNNSDAGTYELTFTITATPPDGCPISNSINIEVEESLEAGTGGSISQCNEDGIIDLSVLLTGNETGGIWSINTASILPIANAFDATNATFDPLGNDVGVYIFDYTLSGGICPDDFTSVTINIVSCDCPSVELGLADPICNDGGIINLSTLQITTELGIWSISSSPSGGNPANLDGTTFDATNADAGIYEVTFTLSNTPPDGCPTNNSINIEVNATPNAGTGSSIEICEDDTIFDLNTLISGNDAGGIWSINVLSTNIQTGTFDAANATLDLTGNLEGIYIFDYTLLGQNECPNATESVTINIVSCDCPSVELGLADPICNNGIVDLLALQVTTEVGTWSITNNPNSSTASINGTTFNANNTISGNYELTFTLDEMPPDDCPESNSVLLIIEESGTAGTAEDAIVICSSGSETIDLFEQLNGEDLGGIWFETSNIPSTGIAFNSSTGTFDMTGQGDGVYTFLYTVGNINDICPPDAETVTIEISPFPIAFAGEDAILDCNILQVTLTGSNLSGEEVDFVWMNSQGEQISSEAEITVNEEGEYTLVATSLDGLCTSNDEVLITSNVDYPEINAGEDVELDCDETVWDIQATGSIGDEFIYNWDTNNGSIENSSVLMPSVTQAGTYNVTVTNSNNGCSSTDEMILSFINGINGLDMVAEGPPCFGDESGYIFINSIDGGTAPLDFSLNNQSFGSTQSFTNLSSGFYELSLFDANGCSWDTIIVFDENKEIELNLGENQFIDFGDPAYVEATTNVSVLDTIIWDYTDDSLDVACLTIDCLDLISNPTETVTFSAIIYDENGCSATAFVTVVVKRDDNVYIPSAFSPNNDGENELLMVFADEYIEKVDEFLVFDRWGETVYQYYNFLPNDPAYGWDGTHRGESLNPQVLVWYAKITFTDGRTEIFKGDVTLVR